MEQNERIDSAAGEPVSACKRRKHLRLAALAVSCALLGGIAEARQRDCFAGPRASGHAGRPVVRRPYPGQRARARSRPQRV